MAAAEAHRRQEEQAKAAHSQEVVRSRRALIGKLVIYVLPVLSVLFVLLLIGFLLRLRAEFRLARRRREHRVAVSARQDDLAEITAMKSDLVARISVYEAVRRKYMTRIAEILSKRELPR
jgi:hypothetical protein